MAKKRNAFDQTMKRRWRMFRDATGNETPKELSKKSGVTVSLVYHMDNGGKPSVSTMEAVARGYGFPLTAWFDEVAFDDLCTNLSDAKQ